MKSAQYRAPANDAVENPARLITRPEFHCNSICTIPFAKLFLLLLLTALLPFQARAQNPPPRLLHQRRPLPSLRRLARRSPRNNWKISLAALRCIPIRCLHKS